MIWSTVNRQSMDKYFIRALSPEIIFMEFLLIPSFCARNFMRAILARKSSGGSLIFTFMQSPSLPTTQLFDAFAMTRKAIFTVQWRGELGVLPGLGRIFQRNCFFWDVFLYVLYADNASCDFPTVQLRKTVVSADDGPLEGFLLSVFPDGVGRALLHTGSRPPRHRIKFEGIAIFPNLFQPRYANNSR